MKATILEAIGIRIRPEDKYTDFYGKPLPPGDYIRWGFEPELGFPVKFMLSNGKTYPTPAAESEVLELMSRLFEMNWVTGDENLFIKYWQAAGELLAQLPGLIGGKGDKNPASIQFFDAPADSGITAMNALMAASLDPYFAALAGLFTYCPPNIPSNVYTIRGDWSGMYYPLVTIGFGTYRDGETGREAISKERRFGRCVIAPLTRKMALAVENNRTVLEINGNAPNAAFSVQFDYPVEYFSISIKVADELKKGAWVFIINEQPVAFNAWEERFEYSLPGFFCSKILIIGPAGTWRIADISYRRKLGEIGLVTAAVQMHDASAVPAPAILGIYAKQSPKIPDNRGKMPANASSIYLPTYVDAPLLNPGKPVLLRYARSVGDTAPTEVTTQHLILGEHQPVVYHETKAPSVVPGLCHYFPFESDCGDEKTDDHGYWSNIFKNIPISPFRRSTTVHGKTPRFIHDHGLKTQVALFDGQTGIATLSADFKNEFSFHFRIKILPGNPGEFALLCPFSPASGFWMGFKAKSGGVFSLILKNKDYEQVFNKDFRTGQWYAVSLTYAKGALHLYDGDYDQLLETYPLPTPDAQGMLCIGAQIEILENGQSVLKRPFRGCLSNLHIWQRAIPRSEAERLIREYRLKIRQQQRFGHLLLRLPSTYLIGANNGKNLVIENPYSNSIITELNNETFKDLVIQSNDYPGIRDFSTLLPNGNVYVQFYLTPALLKYDTSIRLISDRHGQFFFIDFQYDEQNKNYTISVNIRNTGLTEKPVFDPYAHSSTASPGPLKVKIFLGSFISIDINGNLRIFETPPAYNAFSPLVFETIQLGGGIQGENLKGRNAILLLSDLQIWRTHDSSGSDANLSLAQPHWTDRNRENGIYHYFVQGIDIFGRVSDWQKAEPFELNLTPEYSTPESVRAQFVPLNYEIETVKETHFPPPPPDAAAATPLNAWEITIGLKSNKDVWIPARQQAQLSREVEVLKNEQSVKEELTQKYMLLPRSSDDDKINLKNPLILLKAPFAQIKPQAGDTLGIPYDFYFKVSWQWTGMQQLYNEQVNSFRIHLRRNAESVNRLDGVVRAVQALPSSAPGWHEYRIGTNINDPTIPGELENLPCTIGNATYLIRKHEPGAAAKYTVSILDVQHTPPATGEPVTISIDPAVSAYRDVNDEPYWNGSAVTVYKPKGFPFRAEGKGTGLVPIAVKAVDGKNLYVAEFKNIRFKSNPETVFNPSRATYIPSALLAKTVFKYPGSDKPVLKWAIFKVLWHEWSGGDKKQLYIEFVGATGEDRPTHFMADYSISLYVGSGFEKSITLSPRPKFTGLYPTRAYHIAVSASDGAHHSRPSSPFLLIASDRCMPPVPEKPEIVSIGKADFYHRSQALIRWRKKTGEFNLFTLLRSTDTEIFARDMECRRTLTGYYEGLSGDNVFFDDPCFSAWFETLKKKRPEALWSASEREQFDSNINLPQLVVSDLFIPKALNERRWQAMHAIWRRWHDHFYPALDDVSVGALAKREGNETAFTAVSPGPVAAEAGGDGYYYYSDTVNGALRNRYYYRVRAVGGNLLPSAVLSEPSAGRRPDFPVLPPAVPVFTRIEAADRGAVLYWAAAGGDPELDHYLLYRAERREQLADLRWFKSGPDPRIAARVPAARLYLRGTPDAPVLPPVPAGAALLGVYRLDEFDFSVLPLDEQAAAFNYYSPEEAPRRIAWNVPLVLLCRDDRGRRFALHHALSDETKARFQQHDGAIRFADEGLKGLSRYCYRLVAVSKQGLRSEGSEVMEAGTLEVELPETPVILKHERIKGLNTETVLLEIHCESNLEIMIQSRKISETIWSTRQNWTLPEQPEIFQWTTPVDPEVSIEFKVWSRTLNKLRCEYPSHIFIQ